MELTKEQQTRKLNGLRNELLAAGIHGWILGTNHLHGAQPTPVLQIGSPTKPEAIYAGPVNPTTAFLVANGYKPMGTTQQNRATVHTFVHPRLPVILLGIHRSRGRMNGEITAVPYYIELYFGEPPVRDAIPVSSYVKAILARISRESAAPIHLNPAHKGRLHKHLGIPEGEKIPVEKLREAMKSDDPAIRKEANFALNARDFKH